MLTVTLLRGRGCSTFCCLVITSWFLTVALSLLTTTCCLFTVALWVLIVPLWMLAITLSLLTIASRLFSGALGLLAGTAILVNVCLLLFAGTLGLLIGGLLLWLRTLNVASPLCLLSILRIRLRRYRTPHHSVRLVCAAAISICRLLRRDFCLRYQLPGFSYAGCCHLN